MSVRVMFGDRSSSGRAALSREGVANRLIAAVVLAPALSVLAVAAWLEPDPAGLGTHTTMGLPPCGFKAATGLPCVSCGMTTSFAHAADGSVATAFTVQPLGAMLALLCAATVWVGGVGLVSGVSLVPLGRALGHPKVVMALLGLAGLAWGWTITRQVMGW